MIIRVGSNKDNSPTASLEAAQKPFHDLLMRRDSILKTISTSCSPSTLKGQGSHEKTRTAFKIQSWNRTPVAEVPSSLVVEKLFLFMFSAS